MSAPQSSAVPTVGEISRRLGFPVHRIEYVIRARGIKPSGWAGNLRIFSEADVARIGSELQQIESDRSSRHD